MNSFEQRRAAKAERMRELAEKHEKAAEQANATASKMAEAIPLGQPILIGHHSEGRDRRYRAKIGKKFEKAAEHQDKAKYFRGRALSLETNTAIFSDDPEATEKLAEKIERLEKRQELMREANKLVRKKDVAGLEALGFSTKAAERLFLPDFCGRIGFPDYVLQNNGANIRRLKARIEDLEKKSHDETTEETLHGVRVFEDVEGNRLRLFFPGVPVEACRLELRTCGFRWSPTEGAWQRHRSNAATYAARQIIARHYAPKPPEDPLTKPFDVIAEAERGIE